ncbi:MAG: hypothetical protein K6346_08580 [Halothiobacillaceae bacterium]
MNKSRSRDDFSASRKLLAEKLDTHFLEKLEKSGLTLDQRGMTHGIHCIGQGIKGWSVPVLVFAGKKPRKFTLISSFPLEEGQRIILKCQDQLDKKRYIEGIILHSRRGSRQNDDENVFVSVLKSTHGDLKITHGNL